RPDIPNTCFRMNSIRRWIRSLTTPESIGMLHEICS
ncbi:unnamed protein product, partial [Rotaria magnacalcarata]